MISSFGAISRLGLALAAVGTVALSACSSDDSGSTSSGGSGGDGGTSGGGGSGGDGGSGGSTSSGGSGGSTSSGGSGGSTGGSGGSTSSGGSGGGTSSGGSGGSTGGSGGGSACGDCDQVCLSSGDCVECAVDGDCDEDSPVCDPNSNSCVGCLADYDCDGETPLCDLDSNVCVECLPDYDMCETGYCSDDNACVSGCNDDAMCGSGSCADSNECDRCVADTECADGRVCNNGSCGDSCSDEGASCGDAGTCCSSHCIDTDRTIGHCGACGNACDTDEFCTSVGSVECLSLSIANVCSHTTVTSVRDGQTTDDDASAVIRAALLANCDPVPAERNVTHETAEVLNPATGLPLVGPGELLIAAGGFGVNNLSYYLQEESMVPVYSDPGTDDYVFRLSTDDSSVASIASSSQSAVHDMLLIQLVRDSLTGTTTLNAYGFGGSGTAAAAWFFANVMATDLGSFTDTWYVYEWTDDGTDGPSDASEFELEGSG